MVLSATEVLEAISDDKSLELFRIVALTNTNSHSDGAAAADILISKTKLTRKQYYFRMCKLMKAGLIKRKNGKHSLTAFGKVCYYTQMKIENAVNYYYWKLKAVDSLEDSDNLTSEEHKKLIDNLIDNQEIKDIIVTGNDYVTNNRFDVLNAKPSLDIAQQRQQKQKQKQQIKTTNREN